MTQPLPVGGGAFTVDITRAPEAIRELEQARAELYAIRDDAQSLGQIEPPAQDQVSRDAVRLLQETALSGPTSLHTALQQGIDEIDRLIDALRAGFEAYRQSDEASSTQLRS